MSFFKIRKLQNRHDISTGYYLMTFFSVNCSYLSSLFLLISIYDVFLGKLFVVYDIFFLSNGPIPSFEI